MAIGGLVGGYIGGIVSHRANRTVVRSIVIGLGLAVSAHYFWKVIRPGADARRRRVGENSGSRGQSYRLESLNRKTVWIT